MSEPVKLYCPRSLESGGGPDSPFNPPFNGEMTWREDGTCSHCGSFSGDVFMTAVEAGATVVPTDKHYKTYLSGDHVPPHRGAAKFYYQHLSEEQMIRFVELVNTKKMAIGVPGHFYVLPYFIVRGEAAA